MGTSLERPTWREKMQFCVAALLILVGSFGLGLAGGFTTEVEVNGMLTYGSLIAGGYLLGWGVGGRWPMIVVIIAIIARLALLPFAASEDTSRRIWEVELLDSGINPTLVAPSDESVGLLQDERWERILEKDRVSRQSPGSFLLVKAFSTIGFDEMGIKFAALLADLCICILFAGTFGWRRVTLYAWNPLAIFYAAGAGELIIFSLLLAYGAIALWSKWVEQKGGLHLLSAKDVGGGMGQIVGLAAFLAGMAASLNILWLPLLAWMLWLVLRRAGVRAGLTLCLVGLIPLVATRLWGVMKLGLEPMESISRQLFVDAHSMSLFAQDGVFWSDWVQQRPVALFALVGFVVIYWIVTNDALERFGVLVVSLFLLFAPLVHPWHVLLLAPFAGETGRNVFRVATLCSLAYFWSYREWVFTGEWSLAGWQLAFIWFPIATMAIAYGLKYSSKEDGFYVRSY